MTGKELCSLMKRNKVTVKDLAARMKVTQARVREARKSGVDDAGHVRDWTEACEPVPQGEDGSPEPMASAARVTSPAKKVDPEMPKVRPVFLLPANLGPLAKLAAKENPRYAMAGVRVESTDGGYRCVATDGKVLGVVVGEVDDADAFPEVPALQAAPGTKSDAVVPTKAWTDAFKSVSKRTYKPVLNNVAAALGESSSVLATTDLDQANVLQPRNVDGRYPAFEAVFPKRKPRATFRVDADLLRKLLEVAAQFAADDNHGVTVEVYGDNQPVAVRTSNQRQKFDGLVMPLS